MKILVTGADGFIGSNLRLALAERGDFEILPVTRATTPAELTAAARRAERVVHLAGVNRPRDPEEFEIGNVDFTKRLTAALASAGRSVPLAFASSIQAELDNPYGRSKRAAEEHLAAWSESSGSPVAIYRLANVFGKWCRPNYNSAVATFCHNVARGLPIEIHDPDAELRLVYVDDVVAELLRFLAAPPAGALLAAARPVYETTVGALARQIEAFADARSRLFTEPTGGGLVRALFATYVSHLPPGSFSYPVPKHGDERGLFVEMLKTRDAGQFSCFTAHPGVTRGGHYHHTKVEKFLVVKGRARFRFRNLADGATHVLETTAEAPEIVETAPGWAHDVTNIGEEEMVVMLWASEVFDHERPDTIACAVEADTRSGE